MQEAKVKDMDTAPAEVREIWELPWPKPTPFEEERKTFFPTDSLPGAVREYVRALSESTQTSPEMAGTLALGVLATAAQSKYRVEVTPDWREPLCLYTLASAEPGERKSAVISALLEPVREYEREVRELEAAEVASSAGLKAALDKSLQSAQRRMGECTPGSAEFERAAEKVRLAAQEAASFKEKTPCRLLVDDTTPEKLVDIMSSNGGSVTVASSEGGIFSYISAGRYDSSGGLDIYLKGHAGDDIAVDRTGRGANFVREPRITVMLTVQPGVLGAIIGNRDFRQRGLTARFLYARCRSMLGARKTDPAPIPDEVRDAYRDHVRFLLSSPYAGTIRLSEEAQQYRREFQEIVESYFPKRWANMRDWGGKLTGAMVRIAALLHISSARSDPTETPISGKTMANAGSVAGFFAMEAEAVYDVSECSELSKDAEYVWNRLVSERFMSLPRRDLYRMCTSRFSSVREFDRALGYLGDRGYIREVTTHPIGVRGTRYVVTNPSSAMTY